MPKFGHYTITVLLLLVLSTTVFSVELKPEIIQVKDNRLYFDLGKESMIFTGADIFTVHDFDTNFAGDIEHSWQGVSVSQQLDSLFLLHIKDSSEIIIFPAVVDSLSVLNIGIGVSQYLLKVNNPVSDHHVIFHSYHNYTRLSDFYSGSLDVAVTFSLAVANRYARNDIYSRPLSYLVVLIPNLNSVYNKNGYLTTSIYNRFDPARAELFFDGDSVKPITSLFDPQSKKSRPFPYNPLRGKDIFNNIEVRPSELKIFSSDKSLYKLADYIADILSRDQCQVYRTDDIYSADIFLYYVPIDNENPSRGLFSIYRLIASSGSDISTNENLEIIGHHFNSLASAIDQDEYFNLLQLVEIKMIEDIGVFPLFRPTIFVACQDYIIGEPFDQEGYILGDNIKKVILPNMGEDNR